MRFCYHCSIGALLLQHHCSIDCITKNKSKQHVSCFFAFLRQNFNTKKIPQLREEYFL